MNGDNDGNPLENSGGRKIKNKNKINTFLSVGREIYESSETRAESQQIVATRLLYCLQYPVPYLSRLQRIHRPKYLKLSFTAHEKWLFSIFIASV